MMHLELTFLFKKLSEQLLALICLSLFNLLFFSFLSPWFSFLKERHDSSPVFLVHITANSSSCLINWFTAGPQQKHLTCGSYHLHWFERGGGALHSMKMTFFYTKPVPNYKFSFAQELFYLYINAIQMLVHVYVCIENWLLRAPPCLGPWVLGTLYPPSPTPLLLGLTPFTFPPPLRHLLHPIRWKLSHPVFWIVKLNPLC